MTGEFDIIARYFAPLSADFEGAFGLKDDAALLTGEFVVTKDVLVEGVHFRAKDPVSAVARKALRVNLSDLAAKGARPIGYFLGCVWPTGVTEEAIAEFAAGLKADQDLFKIALVGGDTTAHRAKGAPFVISVTMFGAKGPAGMIRRSGAQVGDDAYVTGTIGDAGLGLAALAGDLKPAAPHKSFFAERYQLPSPRVSLGGALCGCASAAIDVSDGLIADARHVAEESSVGIEIHAEKIPLSEAARFWLDRQEDREAAVARLASSGDDYEIFFSAPSSRRRSIEMASQLTKTPVARIGTVSRGGGVRLLNGLGKSIATSAGGYDHFQP
ncbi:MAG: thiamine-phosphate kinase [Parvularculaceae bacterium]|nr:thiamine-phosphate kinase [Parvularculaceae bacterium]